jgi:hypothetical protein
MKKARDKCIIVDIIKEKAFKDTMPIKNICEKEDAHVIRTVKVPLTP